MKNISEIRKEWFLEQLEALKKSGMSYSEIAKRLDMLPQSLNNIRNASRGASEKLVQKFCKEFSISHNDLLKRLKNYEHQDEKVPVVREPLVKSIDKKKIPLYDVGSIGGTNEKVATLDSVSSPVEWIDAGDWFPDATAAIRHYGDSMVEYPSGSILVLSKVQDRRLLVWGRNYCIETTEFRITKQLQDGGNDYLIGYSTNKDTYPDGKQIHPPVYIPKDETLLAIYLVLGYVLRKNIAMNPYR